MKPFKSIIKKHASLISLSIFILVCFGIGYWTGLHPRILEQYINLTQREILFYVDDPELFSPLTKEHLVNSSHVRIKYISENPETADICLFNLESYKKIEANTIPTSMTKKEIQISNQINSFRKRISPDFLIQELESTRALPVLWKYDKKKIDIKILFPRLKVNSSLNQKIYDIFNALFDAEFQQPWIVRSNWGTTLLKLDESFLPEEKKAIYIRKLNLKGVVWK